MTPKRSRTVEEKITEIIGTSSNFKISLNHEYLYEKLTNLVETSRNEGIEEAKKVVEEYFRSGIKMDQRTLPEQIESLKRGGR